MMKFEKKNIILYNLLQVLEIIITSLLEKKRILTIKLAADDSQIIIRKLKGSLSSFKKYK